jgi:hypothetical protein
MHALSRGAGWVWRMLSRLAAGRGQLQEIETLFDVDLFLERVLIEHHVATQRRRRVREREGMPGSLAIWFNVAPAAMRSHTRFPTAGLKMWRESGAGVSASTSIQSALVSLTGFASSSPRRPCASSAASATGVVSCFLRLMVESRIYRNADGLRCGVRRCRQSDGTSQAAASAISIISIISSAKSSARSSQASVYSSRNSLWRAIQRKTVALPGIPASLQMARRLSPSASRAQIDMAT